MVVDGPIGVAQFVLDAYRLATLVMPHGFVGHPSCSDMTIPTVPVADVVNV